MSRPWNSIYDMLLAGYGSQTILQYKEGRQIREIEDWRIERRIHQEKEEKDVPVPRVASPSVNSYNVKTDPLCAVSSTHASTSAAHSSGVRQ